MPSVLRPFHVAFPAQIRSRGDAYVREGRVRRLTVGEDFVRGRVKGTSDYRVEIGRILGVPDFYCACPAFGKFGPCKHIWAVLKALEQQDEQAAETLAELFESAEPFAFLAGDDDDDFDDEEELDEVEEEPERYAPPTPAAHERPTWRTRLARLHAAQAARPLEPAVAPTTEEVRYAIDAERSARFSYLAFETCLARRLKDGSFGATTRWVPWRSGAHPLRERADREIFALLRGADDSLVHSDGMRSAPLSLGWRATEGLFLVGANLVGTLAPKLARTGRLYVLCDNELVGPLREDDGPPWRFRARIVREQDECVLTGAFVRADEELALDAPLAVLDGGVLVLRDAVARFEDRGDSALLKDLCRTGELRVPSGEERLLTHTILADPALDPRDVEGLAVREDVAPVPHLFVDPPAYAVPQNRDGSFHGAMRLVGRIAFDYAGEKVEADAPERTVLAGDGLPVLRDLERESAWLARLFELGFQRTRREAQDGIHGHVTAGKLGELVPALLAEGWTVEALGHSWRSASSTSLSVRSGLDWFELAGGARYGDEIVPLPRLLAAARTGKKTVELGDGSVGVLPEAWLAQWELVGIAGRSEGDTIRFTGAQGLLLDGLLAAREDVGVDARYRELRRRWERFRAVRPRKEPRGFRTELRPYQRTGLGWLHALRELGLSGCLADDMGLGKTVQVLALLEELRTRRSAEERLPSLVVAPRSVVFNWVAEATRFAPRLQVLDYTGTGRQALLPELDDADLVVTTYGTLRRDAQELAERRFDLCILDEAQAIKNPVSQAAKAARLVRARQRLALSGTPIENHLGELWSLMQFLEPGLLGTSTAFQRYLKHGVARKDGDLGRLSRLVAPFFLRRTKDAVCTELPEKSELVMTCELGKRERKEYDELRAHYRRALLGSADDEGLDKIRMHVLEALLRLRQAACHPGLIDGDRKGESSAKLEALLPKLEELAAEGHKALVFSQFTSLLAIVRARLDKLGLAYAYLDGRTRKREEQVRRFQEDASCPLFLVSLKAGGSGLNLTAADYVFLLDPWWNPAVETQAVDRAHRIGRTRPVIAYRLIAADTVEERVCELQERKRELFEAVLGGRRGGLSGLTRSDLEALLGGRTG